ncbi:porin [Flexithrix dorotheae]|uniref:porin n=1 Tax=Flexithrix dorotheae TaxID=70993 RepID=UPI000373A784|nr:porin [Flexithrix dorotheae]
MNRLSKNITQNLIFLFIQLGLVTCHHAIIAQSTSNDSIQSTRKIALDYGKAGWHLETSDGLYAVNAQLRFQFRFATPSDTDPLNLNDYVDGKETYLGIRRARIKIGGNAFKPWLKYYMEYELFTGNLLDFRLMIEKIPQLKVKIGQWKIHYNRERIISSGKQQTVDRSILTRPFTIDRQQGVSLYGNLDGGGLANFSYWISALTGTGRGNNFNDDKYLMYMTRWQWNFFGRILPFESSDTKYHSKPAGVIALAAVTNRSPYTRFSQSGGGQLGQFEEGSAGQYRVNQLLLETALMYKGFSWQNEFHWKEIQDKINLTTTEMSGVYFQAGYFLNGLVSWVPKPLEIAYRQAFYDPDIVSENDIREEQTIVVNWFFKDHLNKLTAEVSFFDLQVAPQTTVNETRLRVQWDVSF